MESIKIVIPSHKRGERVLTTKAIDNAILCVAESQAALYAEHNPTNEIVTHPDNVVGICRKRDWILKHFENVFMVDDDITHLSRVYTESGEETKVSADVAYDIVQVTAQLTLSAGAHLFGFSNSPNPIGYNSVSPIELTGFVNGCAFGVLSGSRLWYNMDIVCNDDYWLTLLNAYYNRICVRDTRYYWAQKDTFVNRGGNSEFRNIAAEEQDFNTLQKIFGSVVELRKKKGNLRHPFQKSLCLPF